MTIERLPLELKLASGGEDATFSGLASTYALDKHGDAIAPGAFARTLAEHKAAGSNPALLWSHDPAEPIGVIDALEEGPDGLRIKGRLADTTRARDARALAKLGAVGGLSIGFRTTKARTGPNGARIIEDLDLVEISFVATPANPGARLATIKAADAAERAVNVTTETKGAAPDNAAIEAKLAALAAEVKAATDRADALETQLARPAIVTGKGEEKTPEQKAFGEFLRGGPERVTETKSLRVAEETSGGYLAPTQFEAEIIKGIVEFSPVRAAARVGATASGSVTIPKRTATPTAYWVGETEDRTGTEPAYGQVEIPVHELAAYADVSVRLIEDAAVNVESEIGSELGEQFGKIEGAAFVNGDGVKKPVGFMAADGVPETLNGHATNMSADALIKLFYDTPAAYRNRGAWMMSGPTLGVIRTLKDSQGNYIWRPGLAEGAPETILGRPIAEAVDMPAVAANAFPVVFGDFSRAFRIYDRVGLSVLRDPFTLATKGMIRFHARRRVGAALVLKEAIRKLKMATS